MMYLDLAELDRVFANRWFWSSKRPALARFRRGDHIGPVNEPLDQSVRDRVQAETGIRPQGPIRLLTNLSYFGYCFNPVSFYYCFDATGTTVQFIVAEVNNTPWGEQDTYVARCSFEPRRSWRMRLRKKMHVSPFMPMDIDYRWTLSRPGERLSVYMASVRDGDRIFDATLDLERQAITAWSLAGVLLRFPLQTVKTIGAIHWQAFRLWLKRVPFFGHPNRSRKVVAR